ncbi:substrate-binding domain-containing protein [Paenibacillus sp. 481]|uniref:substrate-binding domain-containing protein n=1 Tax=Paenibacillus sp. 481 TaxID=2835869 RepID=UPI001E322B5B|nr:helix-turn-helix transcriptional regulator [Paenibacillus sp. 481]UHA71817.1 helix-turn-helix transcriptional regulator [Paenibacillus sp. 481]
MTESVSYTVQDIAQLLKVSKLTVYDLIKKGELPAYRVGKQMRVDSDTLEAYKQRGRKGSTRVTTATQMSSRYQQANHAQQPSASVASASADASTQSLVSTFTGSPLVITGQDICLDLLSRHLEKQANGVRPLRSFAGSMEGLFAMFRGDAHIVSTHLFDGETGEYNLPYIRSILVGFPFMVIHVAKRTAGLFVQKGNPLAIQGWNDLSKSGLRLVNRERGAGARVLLDEQLRLHRIDPQLIIGYDHTESSHLAVASCIASGQADVGVGMEKAALAVGLDFVPLIQEQYELVVLKQPEHLRWIECLLDMLRSDYFRQELQAIGGYDTTNMGQIRLEA